MKQNRKMPAIGEEVLAYIEDVGYRVVYLTNDPKERSPRLYTRQAAWFCQEERRMFDRELVTHWYALRKTDTKEPYQISSPR